MEYHLVNWEQLHDSTFKLAQKISKNKIKFDLIVSIARGGYCISHILSDLLSLPITSFTISSYRDLKQSSLPEITFKIENKLHNKNILLVDDISDTGKTFIRGIKYLKSLGAKHITTVSLFIKPWTKFTPDYYMHSVNKWIILPYETRETIESLNKIFRKQKLTNVQSIKRLTTIGLPLKFINKYV
ncbi:hypothetical protein AUK04_01570 [Candidatus Roizmanbacteria bacterium CG2_30_33_16]|uniref:Phosphoribosyltransferase domain-containing protein n=4 Tax=Candidatus Roizmaniibacteriota TaxID=1752723 RepID=A0A2M7E4B2_9BACT|nr:hypothetical protein [Candidatus Roizmanbacteria bacterium]OIP85146.1 MAG: hypothetical protein AUK04_01570 [Candidatus Roizmanbacteria bacterium CG2_30_33_16]PIP64251.1 MAG: hypothetical protein COW96_03570 [Candidatus Roizmanbacteria bacterium CG22_combo_CG10-13_8_21_14_all_33_16]PIV62549.1 MAG: hypothetical protein COS12_02020 [Candidatus Roizmanbacteria bacterium CG01_land_8_20_14_3_00_33_9]PIX70645.1 MAG: hypothetical protein COZ39_04390 [Candidatus Roizmanbacteria bacterium CG_4_10_14_